MKTQEKLLDRANAAKTDANQAIKLFNNLGSLDQTLEKLRGENTNNKMVRHLYLITH